MAAILRLRAGTRKASRISWEDTTGIAAAATTASAWIEDGRATRAASAIADWWGNRYERARREELPADKAVRRAYLDIEPAVARHARTETVDVFADETRLQNNRAYALGYDVEEEWSAMLDACPACWELNGTTAVRPDTLPEYPQLHRGCRCIVLTHLRPREDIAA